MKWFINTITSWSEVPRARHQVTNELIKLGHIVYFIERNSTGWVKIKIRKEKDNLVIVTPFFPINYKIRYRFPIINEFYQQWLYKKLFKIFGQFPVINFDFNAHVLSRYINESIYYCNDEYIGTSKYPNFIVNLYHIFCERKVTKNSVFCISTSPYLTKKLSKFNSRVYEIPLGGPDLSLFHPKTGNKKNGFIHVGLVGTISRSTISYPIINRLLKDPLIYITLVGPVEKYFLKKIENEHRIEAIGTLRDNELYNAITEFDVAIAPYDLNRVNSGATPNKLLLYLACGKPVVVSNLPNMKNIKYPDKSVYISDNEDTFSALVYQAYNENNNQLEIDRKKFSMNNSWGKRIERFLAIASNNGLYQI